LLESPRKKTGGHGDHEADIAKLRREIRSLERNGKEGVTLKL
jgi:hypothetical protein